MGCEIMDIFVGRRVLLDPFVCPHIAHAVEMGSVFNGNGRRTNVPDEDAVLEDLYFLCGGNGSVDLSAGHQHSRGDDSFYDGMFSHNQSAGGVNFAFKPSVDPDSPIKVNHSLEVDTFPKEGEIFVVDPFLGLPLSHRPHYRHPFLSLHRVKEVLMMSRSDRKGHPSMRVIILR